MKSKLLHDGNEKTFAVIFDKGDDVIDGLLGLAKVKRLRASHFKGIGAFERATLGFFEREPTNYKKIEINEQVEVLSLIGDIALRQDGEVQIHAHVVVGTRDGAARGGHLIEARVWPTLEVILIESPTYLRRKQDEETGLALIDPDSD